MPDDAFDVLDGFLTQGNRAGGLDFLIDRFRAAGDCRLFFEAKLMKMRLKLGLPLIQTQSSAEFPAGVRGEYDAGIVVAAREAGTLALERGDIVHAWPYFRAIAEPGPIFDAIDQVQPSESVEQIINIAFAEGVHPVKGLKLILSQHGMCRAITAFGMYPDRNGRAECISLLVRSLHAELMERMSRVIETQESSRPSVNRIAELITGREWLFGEYDYYVDTSHLMSLLPYSLEVDGPESLELMHDLCAYGKRLSPMFQSRGQAPFENPFIDYDEYVLALMGENVEARLAHFRKKIEDSDANEVGTAPAQVLVNLMVRLGRYDEALRVSMDHLSEEESAELSCPSTLQLCNLAKDYDQLKRLARDRADLLSYIAAIS